MESTSTHPELERLLTHQDWLRSLARRLVGDAAAAEDLVQETWIAALKSPPDPSRPARPWLAGVVRRLASMRARGEGRRARRQTEVARPDLLPSTADLVEEVDTQRRLVAQVLELSEPYRTTVMLRYFQNMSSAEIARHQGVPPGTVRWRLKRGLDELRERLDDSFGSRDAWCIALLPLAKLGVGTGTAGSVSGGSVVGSMALLAKVAAGILAIWGLFEIPSLLGKKADLVFAGDPSAELVSLEPEGLAVENEGQNRLSNEIVERDSVAPANRRVRFLDTNREPVIGLRVALDDDSDTCPEAVTNELGEVEFLTALQLGDLYIQRENSFPERLPVEFTAAGVDMVLVAGAQLTGRVLAGEGQQAASIAMEGLKLGLDSDQVLWGNGKLPRGIAACFGSSPQIQLTTDGFGAFQFNNLPQDWSGQLWLPQGLVLEGEGRQQKGGARIYFDGPQSDAIVSVRRLPRLKGRVMGSQGDPEIVARVQCSVDGSRIPVVAASDGEGYFELQLDSDQYSNLRLELASLGGQARANLDIEADRLVDGSDLGEIHLHATSEVKFRAVRSDGSGIEGARVVGSTVGATWGTTDSDGFGSTLMSADVGPCSLQAFGFAPTPFVAESVEGEELVIEMTPTARVKWHVINDRGHTLGGVSLRIRSGERLFADGQAFAPNGVDRAYMLSSFVRAGNDEGLPYGEFKLNSTGRLQLSNLALGAPILVEVLDQMGHQIHSTRMGALTEGEVRDETIEVPGRLHGFHGWVKDRSDQVLAGVELELTDADGKSVRTISGLDGQVVFERLAGNRYDLTVRKRGFVEQTVSGLSFSAGAGSSEEQPYEVIMDRAADLTVHVLSGANVPVPGGHVVARRALDGGTIEAAPYGRSRQSLLDLDHGTLELTLDLAGVLYTEVARPHFDETVEFRVPAHGSALVTCTPPESGDADAEWSVVAVALGLEGEVLADRAPVRVPLGQPVKGQRMVEFPALLPGSYTLELMGRGPIAEGEQGWVPFGEPVRIQVGLDGPARAEMGL